MTSISIPQDRYQTCCKEVQVQIITGDDVHIEDVVLSEILKENFTMTKKCLT